MEALILGVCLIVAAILYVKGQEKFHLKARPGKYSVSINGRTEEAEQMTIVCTIFDDDTEDKIKEKIEGAFALRESRLSFQNQRLLDLQAEHKAGLERARDEKLKQVQADQEAAKLKLVESNKA